MEMEKFYVAPEVEVLEVEVEKKFKLNIQSNEKKVFFGIYGTSSLICGLYQR